jgi:Tfp pilus assembly protein PilF
LAAGLAIGLIIGVVFGVVAFRPDLVGAASSPSASSVKGAARPGPPGDAGADAAANAELARIHQVLRQAKENPDNYDAQVAAGNALFDVNEWSAAEEAYRRALRIKDGDANVITDFGTTLLRQNRIEDALREFDRALAKNPAQWQAALHGTLASLTAKDAKRARVWLDRFKSIAPQHPAIAELEQQLVKLDR